ncbi:MAG: hypothetical protein K2P33_04630, partial [Acutalibacter sp.]|nr:hypothetical protein [Acutalibacter sp.]
DYKNKTQYNTKNFKLSLANQIVNPKAGNVNSYFFGQGTKGTAGYGSTPTRLLNFWQAAC